MTAERKATVKETGFSLVELMVTLVVAMILSAAVYSVYKVQQRSSTAQDQVTEMQQSIRVAFYMLARDLRMAGFDPTKSGAAGITKATAGRFRFTQDITGDPATGGSDGKVDDANEDLDFGFPAAVDANDDGIPDAGGVAALGVQTGGAGGYQPIAENIERIQFLYTLGDGTTTLAPTVAQRDKIVTVTVSILARAGRSDIAYNEGRTYTLGDGTNIGPFNDNFRRRLLVSEVVCRNMVM